MSRRRYKHTQWILNGGLYKPCAHQTAVHIHSSPSLYQTGYSVMSSSSTIQSQPEDERPKAFDVTVQSLDGTEKYYHLDDTQLAFFKAATGITDEAALKAHIIAVQHEAYKVGRLEDILNVFVPQSSVVVAGPCVSMHRKLLLHSVGIYPYNMCITKLHHRLKLSGLPWYRELIDLGKSRQNAVYLDIGCCC